MTTGTPSVGEAAAAQRESEVVRRLGAARVVPVATVDDAAHAEPLARALLRGGLLCVEIAFRTDASREAVQRASRVEGMLVGAGTVLSPEQAEAAAAAGVSRCIGLDSAECQGGRPAIGHKRHSSAQTPPNRTKFRSIPDLAQGSSPRG